MQYSAEWRVTNLMLIPPFFFTETAIEKRPPLGPNARRAGWIGCNIRLSAIAPEGKIRLVTAGIAADPVLVRIQYKKVTPLARLTAGLRGWTLDVLRFIHKIGRRQFTLDDVYAFEGELAEHYPANRHIRPKIRQQLQVLREIGLVEFLGRGRFALAASNE
jgi:type II restriction enzyme